MMMKGKDEENFKSTYADNVSMSDSEFSEQKVIKQADADRCVSEAFKKSAMIRNFKKQ